MGDKVSSFTITFDGEAGTVKSVLAALKSQIKSDVADIQATADKLDVFKNLQQQAKDAANAFFTTKARVEDLRTAIEAIRNAGGAIGTDLAKSLKAAETAAASARKEFETSRDRLATLRTQLTGAGVDTRNLAVEQQRLAAAARDAALAAVEQQQKQALGFKTLRDVQPELDRLRASYLAIRDSGKLSFTELTALQGAYQKQVAQVRGEVSGLGSAFQGVKANLVGFSAAAAAVGLSIGGIVAGISSAIEAAQAYNAGLENIGVISNVTRAQLDGLGAGARELSRELGIDVTDALKALFDIIRSGVPPDNALDVLRASAIAAKASFTDVGTGAKAASLLLNAFGVTIDQLPTALDKIVKSGHDGGLTLKEFADSAGPLLNVAKAAGIGFDDLVATLTVLSKAEGDSGQATTDLTKIIQKLDTTAAREKLHALGIEGDTLVSIFSQIGAKGLGLHEILDLGVASTKSAAGISALTKNAHDLAPELEAIRGAAGTAAESVAKLSDTAEQRNARLKAAFDESKRQIGEGIGASAGLAVVGTRILDAWNLTYATLNKADKVVGALGISVVTSAVNAIRGLVGLPPAATAASTALQKTSVAVQDTADRTDRMAVSARKAAQDLSAFGATLTADVQAIQSALSRNISDANADAAAQIAALDRSLAASKATAAATLQIQTKLAADRLALISQSETEINAAIDKAAAARAATVKKGSDDEKNLAKDTAAARIAALQPVLAQYQTHYNSLVAQAQAAATQIREIDQQRVDFNRGIEQQLFNLRLEGLSAFDQYTAKAQEADRLIAESQKAAADGTAEGAKRAKQFADEAIAIAGQLGTVTDQNGVKIVTALQLQSDKTGILRRAQEAVNTALDNQKKAATDSLDANKKGIDEVLPKLTNLKDQYDALKKTVDAGLLIKVQDDEASVAKALATLNDLTKDRTVTITVNTVNRDGTPAPAPGGGDTGIPIGPSGQPLATGGPVRAQRYAAGGSVFRAPTWNKVPGIGNADTVPARLNAGSFVVRKAASQHYGDALLNRLTGVRGYASGGSVFGLNDRSNGNAPPGTVTPQQIQQYAESKWGFDPFSSKVYDPGNIGGRTDSGGGGAPQTDPKKGYRSGDTFQDAFTQRVISLDTRPIPAQYITASNVIQYAREMVNSVGQENPLLGSLSGDITSGIEAVSRNPANQAAITALLQAAETIGSNPYLFAMWGKTAGSPGAALVKPEWFIDWLTDRGLIDSSGNPTTTAPTTGNGPSLGGGIPANFAGNGQLGSLLRQNPLNGALSSLGTNVANRLFHPVGNLLPNAANNFAKNFFQSAIPAAGDPPFVKQRQQQQLEDLKNRLAQPFEDGGASTDTVPAMLTPGEFVVNKAAADAVGAPLLWAINEMRLPKADLSYLLEAPRIPRFAAGGYVGIPESRNVSRGAGTSAGATVNNISINASVADILTEANILRYFVPVWNGIQQRSRRS